MQRSPCSTFKIISALFGIEKGIIQADHSIRTWSGETFWNEKWNRDIDFKDAFQASCIWYFREVIDELGPDIVQEQLDLLKYGNRDISDWEGYLNHNNNNRALTGFWVESSLKISPKEQTEVMARKHEKFYFCIYLGQSDQMEVSSAEAKKIAIQIICENFPLQKK